jgi:Ras-related protein Rab-8A
MSNRVQNYDCLIKLLVIGNSGVGKTNMLLKFCENNFMTSHLTTIGIDFKTKTIMVGKDKIRLQIWDTAGQEKFKTITQTYYRGAMGIILTYSIAERESFQDIQNWVQQIKMHASDNVLKVLVGNKADVEERQVDYSEGEALAKHIGVSFYETSAKTGDNIETLFHSMAEDIKRRIDQEEKVGVLSYTGSKLHRKEEKKEGKSECC